MSFECAKCARCEDLQNQVEKMKTQIEFYEARLAEKPATGHDFEILKSVLLEKMPDLIAGKVKESLNEKKEKPQLIPNTLSTQSSQGLPLSTA